MHFLIITTGITFIEIRYSDWSRTVIRSHWPVFHFSMNPVRIYEGRGHSRQNLFCDTVQCFYEEKWTAYNYWHLTLHLLIFSGRKAEINLHTTPKFTVVMPINCLLRSIQFPSPQNDASCTCACFPATLLYVFSRVPFLVLSLLTVSWFIQHFLCNSSLLSSITQ